MKHEIQNHTKCYIKTCAYDTFTLTFKVEKGWNDQLKAKLREVAASSRCFAVQGAEAVDGKGSSFDVVFTGDIANGHKMTPSVIKSIGYALQGVGCLSLAERTQLGREAERAPTPPGVRRI